MSKIWTIKEVLNWTTFHFKKNNIPEPRLSAELLLGHLLKCKRLDLYLRFDQILTKKDPQLSHPEHILLATTLQQLWRNGKGDIS